MRRHGRRGIAAAGALVALGLALAPGPAQASDSRAFQVNVAHSGAQYEQGLNPPFRRRWVAELGDQMSYPVIADGRVFVTVRNSGGTYGSRVVALDAGTGAALWSRALGGTYYWSGIAYDEGRLYAVNGDGLLVALTPATGEPLWSRQLPGQYSFSSPPTADEGMVYVGGAGSGGTLYAVRGATGDVVWTQPVANGDNSSPAVGLGKVYVSYACLNVYAFGQADGAPAWRHQTGCSGGGGRTPALHEGRLYARDGSDGVILDAGDGEVLGAFPPSAPPAFGGLTALTVSQSTLEAIDLSTGSSRWTFSDGAISSAPMVVNEHVIVGSANGAVYALELATGRPVWVDDQLGEPVPAPDEHNVSQPLTGFGAGGGLVVVPAMTRLFAYEVGEPGTTGGGTTGGGTGSTGGGTTGSGTTGSGTTGSGSTGGTTGSGSTGSGTTSAATTGSSTTGSATTGDAGPLTPAPQDPAFTVVAPDSVSLRTAQRRGIRLAVTVRNAGSLVVAAAAARARDVGRGRRKRAIALGRALRYAANAGTVTVRLKLRRGLRLRKRRVPVAVAVSVTAPGGAEEEFLGTVVLRRR